MKQVALPVRPLGDSGLEVSRLGLGCASYWAHPRFPEARAQAVMQRALEGGITLFDTGASYADGHAELRLGRLLRALNADPDALIIATKAGTRRDARGRLVKDFSPEHICGQVTASLRRLGLKRVSLLLLHGPAPDAVDNSVRETLARLRDSGQVGYFGINADHRVLEHFVDDELFRVLMPFLSVREPEAVSLSRRAGVAGQGVLAAGPLARMSFRPPWRDWLRQPAGRWYLARALARAPRSLLGTDGLRKALTHPDWTPAQLALAWALEQPGVSAAVFGTTRPEHVDELVIAADRALPEAVRQRLEHLTGAAA